jgi:hypothetical protein
MQSLLTLGEKLNMICNNLANGVVMGSLSHSAPVICKLQLLPLEKAAVFVGTKKMTMDVGPKICLQLGKEEVMRFLHLICDISWGDQQRRALVVAT